jgi:hypothetical protein
MPIVVELSIAHLAYDPADNGFSRLPLCRHGGATGFVLKSPRSLALPAR